MAMIRDLAERKGVSPDEALREALEREAKREAEVERRMAAMMDIVRRARALLIPDPRSPDAILGYDESGLPT